MLERIQGVSPLQPPTDMGVNMAGFAIVDDDACRDASCREIARRYFHSAEDCKRSGTGEQELHKIELLMSRVGISTDVLPARKACLIKKRQQGSLWCHGAA